MDVIQLEEVAIRTMRKLFADTFSNGFVEQAIFDNSESVYFFSLLVDVVLDFKKSFVGDEVEFVLVFWS